MYNALFANKILIARPVADARSVDIQQRRLLAQNNPLVKLGSAELAEAITQLQLGVRKWRKPSWCVTPFAILCGETKYEAKETTSRPDIKHL